MSRTRGSKSARGDIRKLAGMYRRFAEAEAARISPLYERIALALSESEAALHAIRTAPARRRHPASILAALHDLALAGRAPDLAAAYTATDHDTAAGTAIDTLLRMTDPVVELVVRHRPWTDETRARAVLYPAIAEAARRVGAHAVGLIDVDCAAGFDLTVDRAGITYSNGQALGDPSSPSRLSSSVVGDRALPAQAIPQVTTRIGIDRAPFEVTDAEDARWLRACLPPDRPERIARLDADIGSAASVAPLLLRGDALDLLPGVFARVPAGTLPIVTTAWALSRYTREERLRFLHHLEAAGRVVAWVSAEGVGVAPAIPTLGDRPASGHSIIGLAVFDGTGSQTEALGRCWSRGRILTWLADPSPPRAAVSCSTRSSPAPGR
ncbi:DUF2332 domain-containing protein [Nocardia sp. CA-290969]|uniref:DUF2332 domain-containing protein n=1 Tax=Nocardia sp. CA-290969 TaxID=3239986 RepID=UPI003D912FBD